MIVAMNLRGKISDYKRSIRFSYERVRYGYDSRWFYDFYSEFLKMIPKILRDFEANRVGCPCDTSNEEWSKTIQAIIFFMEEASEDTTSYVNPYDKIRYGDGEGSVADIISWTKKGRPYEEEWLEEEKNISAYHEFALRTAMNIMTENFWDLWD